MCLFGKLFKKKEQPAPEEVKEELEEELDEEFVEEADEEFEEDVDVGPQKSNKEIYDEVAGEMALTGVLKSDIRSWTEKLHAELTGFATAGDKEKARRVRVCILNTTANWDELLKLADYEGKAELVGVINNLKRDVPLIEKDLDKGPKYYARHVVPALNVLFAGADNIVTQLIAVLDKAGY